MTSGRAGRGRARVLGLLTALTVVLASALAPAIASRGRAHAVSETAKSGQATWTFMIYDSADNNIAGDLIENLDKLTALPAMSNVNVVALVDMPGEGDPGYPAPNLTGVPAFTDTKLVVLDGGKWNVVRDLGEQALGRPDTLASFIDEAADRFPAAHYGLSLSDHGGAFYGAMSDDGPPGSRMLSLTEIRSAILGGLQRAGIARLDLLDQDSCLMSNYEANTLLGPLARTIVGSEESTFTNNTMAPEAVAALAEDPGDGRTFAKVQTKGYADYITDNVPDLAAFTAMSAVDGDAMKQVDRAVSAFAAAAVAHMDEVAPAIARARGDALEFEAGLEGMETNPDWNLVDLGDFLRHLQGMPKDVEVARDAAYQAVQRSVVAQDNGSAAAAATGLSIHLPLRANSYTKTYLSFAPAGWGRMITAFLQAQQGQAGQAGQGAQGAASFASPEASVVSNAADGIKIAAQLVAGSSEGISDAYTQVEVPNADQRVVGVVLPAYLDAGAAGTVQGVWNDELTGFVSGGTRAPATVVYRSGQNGLSGVFAAQYTAPGQDPRDVIVKVLLDSDGAIQGWSVQDADSDQNTAGITLAPGGTITPYLFVGGIEDGTPTPGTPVPVGAGLDVVQFRLPAGTPFRMSLEARGSDGSRGSAVVETETR